MTEKIALIPAFEPKDNIIKLLQELKQNNYINIVIDDGSGDKYVNIFKECEKYAKVIRYTKNRGKGYALKTGFKYIKENFNNFIIVTIDSDGQHKVSDANKLVEFSEKNKKELVIGKRIREGNIPFRSKIGNEITREVFRLTTKLDVYDTQTGLRSFSNNLIDLMIKIQGDRYDYEMNVLLEFAKRNIKINEIEIQTIYENNNSCSHFNPIKDSLEIYKRIIKFSLSSIISFLIDYIFYTAFFLIYENINLANILARLISSICNYIINRNLVFKSNNSILKSLSNYIILAIFILILNTTMLNLFVLIGIKPLMAKILTECILFLISWIIQNKIVFNRNIYNKINKMD